MMNIKFPKTNVVACVFSYKTRNTVPVCEYDKFDKAVNSSRLKRYFYRVPKHLIDTLKVGDTVVVHCQTGYQICEVAEINAFTPSAYKEEELEPVVCKVDLSSYIEEVEHQEELERMKVAIEKEKKRLESLVTYELIAEKNPEFAAMLKAFKEAGGSF